MLSICKMIDEIRASGADPVASTFHVLRTSHELCVSSNSANSASLAVICSQPKGVHVWEFGLNLYP